MLELVMGVVGVPMFTFAIVMVPTLVAVLVVLVVKRKNKEKQKELEVVEKERSQIYNKISESRAERIKLREQRENLLEEDDEDEYWDEDSYTWKNTKPSVETSGNNNKIEIIETVTPNVQDAESVLATPRYHSDITPTYSNQIIVCNSDENSSSPSSNNSDNSGYSDSSDSSSSSSSD